MPAAARPARAGGGQLALFPNPARAAATATLTLGAGAGRPLATAQLFDGLGRAVGPGRALVWAEATATAALPLAGLAAGVYAVRVQAGQTVLVQRLLVQP